jgi:hypothetical protein
MKCINCGKNFEIWEDEYCEVQKEFCEKCKKDRDNEEAWLHSQQPTINESPHWKRRKDYIK